MSTLDSDVRSLINHLYFEVSAKWIDLMKSFLWSPDTERDAELWVETKPGTSEVQLRKVIGEFVIRTDEQMERLPAHDYIFSYPIRERPRQKGNPRPCFLAMPTKDWLPDVQRTIEAAAAGFECKLSVDNAAPGDIMNQVWADIRKSDVLVADLTGMNPNVFYEMGLAHALGKTTILIRQKDKTCVPFDLRNHKNVEYDTNKLTDLEDWLRKAFQSVPPRYNFD